MAIAQKLNDGNYYVRKSRRGQRSITERSFIFRAYAVTRYRQAVNLHMLYVPKELFGKKFRLKLEVIR